MELMIWKRFGLIALLLAPPVTVFVGETHRTAANGEAFGEFQVNDAGILLAVAGFVLAASATVRRTVSVREDAPTTPRWARGIAAVLALAGAVQIAVQIAVQAGFVAL